MLEGYDIEKLEDQIFEVEDDIVYDTSIRLTERQQTEITIEYSTKWITG